MDIEDLGRWKELGYPSFTQMWRTQMTGTVLVPGDRRWVVYALYDEGCSPEEVTDLVMGLTLSEARTIKINHEADIPIGRVSGTGPHERHYRKY